MTFWFTFDHIIGNNVGYFFPDNGLGLGLRCLGLGLGLRCLGLGLGLGLGLRLECEGMW